MTSYVPGDATFGIKKETTFGTAVTVDAHLSEVHAGDSLQPGYEWLRGSGLRQGRVGPGLAQRVRGKTDPAGDLTVDANSVDVALLLEAAFGTVTTGGPAAPYGRLYTPKDGGAPPSYTIQKGIPLSDGSAVKAHTFDGMVCASLEITAGNDAILQMQTSWVGHDMKTDTAYAAAAYTAGQNLFTFNNGSVAIGGTATIPTATTPSTGGTAVANIRECSVTLDNGLYADRFNYGGAGKRSAPTYGPRTLKGSLTAEFDVTTYRDASLAGTDLALVLTFTGGENEKLQIVVPHITLDSTIPNAATDFVTQQFAFEGNVDSTDLLVYALLQNTVAV